MVIEPGNSFNANSSTAAGTGKSRHSGPAVPTGKQEKTDAQGSNAHSPDSVSLSSAGQNLAKLEAELAQAPDVDEAKVAEARTALANGSYTVDAETIASKLLDQDALL
ncbi:flagellar biosynthesis anti-sigma factor FlgM [Teredinibacter franksiae]|uniref:flagellar biosynthesis anti-sigma factor FlgM n=1 Tax=Teredinibacter franksiae TaxID=2761453 RepID=UPI00162A6A51|nr:flagellar biosynthesis anti-sigma factor FlgM [Teredinibacter franksiae]